jgi:hypothetical protein
MFAVDLKTSLTSVRVPPKLTSPSVAHEVALATSNENSYFQQSIAFGEHQVMGQPMATRWLVSPLIDQDYRDGARLNHVSATLNHQDWPRARLNLQNFMFWSGMFA